MHYDSRFIFSIELSAQVSLDFSKGNAVKAVVAPVSYSTGMVNAIYVNLLKSQYRKKFNSRKEGRKMGNN